MAGFLIKTLSTDVYPIMGFDPFIEHLTDFSGILASALSRTIM